MNKITTCAMVLSGLFFTSGVCAQDKPGKDGQPIVFGNLNAAVVDQDSGDDIHSQALEAAVGIRGFYKGEATGGVKIVYKLELEATNAMNATSGDGDLQVKNAVIAFPTSAGTFVMAPHAESGQQKDLYGPVDIFDVFEANRNSGLFDQPDEATSILAYVTPKFADGKVVAKFAVLNLGTNNDDNGEDVDASAYRILYNGDALSLGFGQVFISDAVVPTDDYHRTQFSGKYKFGSGHHVGLIHEQIEDHPAQGDFDTTGVVLRYNISDDYDAGFGIYTQSGDRENDSTILNLRKKMGKVSYLYTELADFDKNDMGYFSFGVNVSFSGTP